MSGSQDNLKNMFTEAFAAEQIPVDMGAWNQMEALLNKRKPFGFAYWTLLPFLLLLTGLMSWYGFTNISEAIYSPRAEHADLAALGIIGECDGETGIHALKQNNAGPIATAQIFDTSQPVDSENKSPINLNKGSNAVINNTRSESVSEYAADNQNTKASNSEIENPIVQSPASTPLPAMPANEITTSEDSEAENDIADVEPQKEIEKPLVSTVKSLDDNLSLMPILDLSFDNVKSSITPKNSNPLVNETSYNPSIYLRAGVNKTFGTGFENYAGFGQSVGVGYQRQIRPHWMISADLNGNRLRTGDTAQIAGQVAYGFSQFENHYVVTTTELLRVNTTLFAHYRIKRLYLGVGLQPFATLALKNQTDQSVRNGANETEVGSSEGYYQWNRYRRMGGDGVVDIQYQIVDDTFLGLRSSYGLTNSLNVDHKTLRLLQLEAYLKLNIR